MPQESKINKNKFYFIWLFVVGYLLFVVPMAQAASFSADNIPESVGVGQQFQLDIFVDSENDILNTIEGSVKFSENDFKINDIRDGNSSILLWIDKPKTVSGAVTFSGMTPNGIVRDKNFIISLILEPRRSAEALVTLTGTGYLNDGNGTKVTIKPANFKISVKKELQPDISVADLKNDRETPEDFIPVIVRDDGLLSGKYAVIFETQDKFSGIDRYEIAEPKLGLFGVEKPKWGIAVSPYTLNDQSRESFVYIKAVDRNGNERIKKISPEKSFAVYKYSAIWFILIVLLLAIGYFTRKKLG